MRLNRKRKASDEREADKERSKKICLERSAAKTLLTLHRHAGKSKEEHEAAGTLLDLSLESVVSSEEAEIEDLTRNGEADNRLVSGTDRLARSLRHTDKKCLENTARK